METLDLELVRPKKKAARKKRTIMPLPTGKCWRCHNRSVMRTLNPKVCTCCNSEIYYDRTKKAYKPKPGYIKLYCHECSEEFWVRPSVYEYLEARKHILQPGEKYITGQEHDQKPYISRVANGSK